MDKETIQWLLRLTIHVAGHGLPTGCDYEEQDVALQVFCHKVMDTARRIFVENHGISFNESADIAKEAFEAALEFEKTAIEWCKTSVINFDIETGKKKPGTVVQLRGDGDGAA